MPAKIRLARHGKKRKPIYHIVVADSRAPRDGKYTEKLGLYNPNTNPATIDLDFDKALDWLLKGAQPTDTARFILSSQGVLMKKHLLGGIKKGALTEEQAESKFQEWLKNKEAKVSDLKKGLEKKHEQDRKERLEAEAKINEERAQEIAKKNAELAASEKKKEEAEEGEPEAFAQEVESKADTSEKGEVAEVPKEEESSVEEVKAEETKAETAETSEEEVEKAEEEKVAEEVKSEEEETKAENTESTEEKE